MGPDCLPHLARTRRARPSPIGRGRETISRPLFFFLFLFTSCGKVGNPQPPFIRIPEAVTDLAVHQAGNTLVLTWTNPARYIDRSPATDLARARILSNGTTVAVRDVGAPGQPESLTIAVESATGTPRSFAIQLETRGRKTSQISNSVSITPVEVPGEVARLTAVVDQHRIIVEWQPPGEHPELAHAYSVTRMDSSTESVIVDEPRWEDPNFQRNQTYRYAVTSLRRIEDRVVPGLGPQTVSIEAVDKTPPKVPAGLESVAGDNGGFITWTANEERDFAGYRVYRSDRADGGFVQVGDSLHTTNALFDPGYRAGLYYAVSAVDEFGNESPRSMPLRVQ